MLFYYSVLEQTVNASYIGTHNNLNSDAVTKSLSILSSIGILKPPFQFLKLCFWKEAEVMDHMFITYYHPIIVTCLIFVIFISARNSVTAARTIGRYVNSKSICILLILSYSLVSYTSVQLLRPLAVYTSTHKYCYWDYGIESWHSYLSPIVKYFQDRHLLWYDCNTM